MDWNEFKKAVVIRSFRAAGQGVNELERAVQLTFPPTGTAIEVSNRKTKDENIKLGYFRLYLKLFSDEIKKQYPSICYTCRYARNPTSEENLSKGFVGCSMRVQNFFNKDHEDIDAAIIGEGWIDNSMIMNERSGRQFNFQLITKGTRNCKHHSAI